MTIFAGQKETHSLAPGNVVKVVTDANSTGIWRKIASPSGLFTGLLGIPASKTMYLGPYYGQQRIQLECLTGSLVTSIIENHSEGPGFIYIDRSHTISLSNASMFNGKMLGFTAAFTLTLDADLPPGFGFAYIPPVSGNASFASINSGGLPTINGATTTVTKSASDVRGALIYSGENAFTI